MHDGAIVFSTKLDNKDLEKDLARYGQKIEKIEKQIFKDQQKKMPLVEQSKQLAAVLDEAKAKLYEMQNASRGTYSSTDIAEQRERVKGLQAEWNKVQTAVERYDHKIEEATEELAQAKSEAGELQQRLAAAGPSTEKMARSMEKARKSANKFALRLREVTRSALIFTLITQTLAKFRDWMGKVIKTNSEATAAIARLKGALLTMAQPIVEVILPAFIALVNVLTRVISVIAQLFAMLSGKSIDATKKAAAALNEETEALEGAGAAADEAAGSLAGFDEINTIQTENASGGSASEGISPDFAFDADLTDSQLRKILGLIKLIGAALLGWKIGSALGLGLKNTLGLMVAIYGVIEFVSSLFDAWTNGVSWDNLQGMIFGLTLAVIGLYVAFGPVAAGIAMIVGGLAMLVVGFKDAFENGWNLQNLLSSVAGLFAAGLGISLLTGSFIPALIAGIAALVLAFTVAMGHGEEFLDGLKEIFSGFVDFFKGVFTGDMELAAGGIEKIFSGLENSLGAIIDSFRDLFDKFFDWLDEKTGGRLSEIIDFMRGLFDGLFDFVDGVLGDILDSGKEMLQGLLDFISGVFTGDWDKAWQGVKEIFSGVFNGIVGILEGAVNTIIRGLNWLISQMNKISFDVPDWLGGGHYGINIAPIREWNIPRLATGSVIPPNREFLAVLGDNKTETEVVSPLSTMKQAMLEALQESGGAGGEIVITVVTNLDGKEIARNQVKHINNMTIEAGKSVLIY